MMEAIIIGFCMVVFAGVLTHRDTKQKAYSGTSTQEKEKEKMGTTYADKGDKRPYYDQYISKNKKDNNFIDYSNGIMGI